MKKVVWLLLMLCFSVLSAQASVEWNYPLDPELLQDNEGFITLVNRDNLLEEDYVPHDLQKINVRCVGSIKGDFLRKPALEALNAMFKQADSEGIELYAKSVYRSYQTQKTMYYNRLQKYGKDDGVVAYPGSSDHQTGLGMDILNYAWTKKDGMRPEFGLDKEAIWMAENCHKFGFIIRYMEDKEDITGIIYEPWHLRYCGKEVAEYIYLNHLSLEEFDAEWKLYIKEYEQNGGNFDQLLKDRQKPNPVLVLEETEEGEEEVSLFYPR